MGFYTPATIVADAQRHGIRMRPVCVRESDWRCQVVSDDTVRLGFCVVNGLREEHGEVLVAERERAAFASLDDFKRRVGLTKEELRTLAELGALNCFAEHRRAAMWRVEEQPPEPLIDSDQASRHPERSEAKSRDPVEICSIQPPDSSSGSCRIGMTTSPLLPMTMPERVKADYDAMNLTTGPHPMKLLRQHLPNIWRATDLPSARHGATVQIAGNVICRQRPGTAKGFVFISLEDETGVSNAIVTPDLFERVRLLITEEPFLVIEGQVQNSENVVLIKAREIRALAHEQLVGTDSHDFH
jgi:error-prone DNA polymerase